MFKLSRFPDLSWVIDSGNFIIPTGENLLQSSSSNFNFMNLATGGHDPLQHYCIYAWDQ